MGLKLLICGLNQKTRTKKLFQARLFLYVCKLLAQRSTNRKNQLNKRKQISRPKIQSAIRPVRHRPGIPVPSPPNTVENISLSYTESEIDDNVDELYDYTSDEP